MGDDNDAADIMSASDERNGTVIGFLSPINRFDLQTAFGQTV
jgi:hypothetical protein